MKHSLSRSVAVLLVVCCAHAAPLLRAQAASQSDPAKVLDQLLSNYER